MSVMPPPCYAICRYEFSRYDAYRRCYVFFDYYAISLFSLCCCRTALLLLYCCHYAFDAATIATLLPPRQRASAMPRFSLFYAIDAAMITLIAITLLPDAALLPPPVFRFIYTLATLLRRYAMPYITPPLRF